MNIDISEVRETLDRILPPHLRGKVYIMEEGGDIELKDIEKFVGPEGVFGKYRQWYLVYIYNQTYQSHYGKDPVNNIEDRRRVHLTNCWVLQKKQNENDYKDKFVWVRRGDEKFPAKLIIDNKEPPEKLYELLPCQPCLDIYNKINNTNIKREDFNFGDYLDGKYEAPT